MHRNRMMLELCTITALYETDEHHNIMMIFAQTSHRTRHLTSNALLSHSPGVCLEHALFIRRFLTTSIEKFFWPFCTNLCRPHFAYSAMAFVGSPLTLPGSQWSLTVRAALTINSPQALHYKGCVCVCFQRHSCSPST